MTPRTTASTDRAGGSLAIGSPSSEASCGASFDPLRATGTRPAPVGAVADREGRRVARGGGASASSSATLAARGVFPRLAGDLRRLRAYRR